MYRDNKIQDIENIFKNKITRKNKMCNIGCLYANCGSSLPIKKQCYQGIELYVITESLTINEAILANCCKTEDGCPPESLFLEVRSNQALCVGYTSYCLFTPLFLIVYPSILRKGAFDCFPSAHSGEFTHG